MRRSQPPGIAVGSVCVYFPTKADLTTAMLTRFFVRPSPGILHVVRAECSPCSALRDPDGPRASMSVDWFAEMRRLPQEHAKKCEASNHTHGRGLQRVLGAGEAVDRAPRRTAGSGSVAT